MAENRQQRMSARCVVSPKTRFPVAPNVDYGPCLSASGNTWRSGRCSFSIPEPRLPVYLVYSFSGRSQSLIVFCDT